jgi:Ca2+-transporting ATPase
VVRGDLLVISEGDRVAADAILLRADDVQADESLLTGESAPVRKQAVPSVPQLRSIAPGGDDLPYIFSGSLVVRGSGVAEVIATGSASEIGKIGHSLQAVEPESPRLSTEMRRMVRLFAAAGGLVSVAAVLLYGLMRGGWLNAVLSGITLGMSMLPEEFPVILTVFMAMGAWRISQARVLTRRAAAIETLGSATVLCTDKTGTLTENRMSIRELRLPSGEAFSVNPGEAVAVPEPFRQIVDTGVLASAPDAVDPMEVAFHRLGEEIRHNGAQSEQTELSIRRTYGLRPDLLSVTQVWGSRERGEPHVVAAKGAPETIADLCHLSAFERRAADEMVSKMAEEGLRVLGVARGSHISTQLPESQHDFDFEYLGLVGLADPLRPTAPAAIRECQSAGINVIMITGDYPATAEAIAGQVGLINASTTSGTTVATLSDGELARRVRTTSVFARIMPDQKLRIVSALKANGEIVAMTGDGVNDAPALKSAHIGIAMGGRGTDVAREASSIVLLDDDFGSIVKTIRLGRRIYDNLRKAAGFIFAVHVPIAGLALLPLVLGMPVVLGPVHIAFLEMVIDPVCSLVFEAEGEEEDVMRRPPRPPEERLFTPSLVTWSIFQGSLALAAVAAVFLAAYWRGLPEADVRALAFFSLVAVIVSLIFVNRSFSSSITQAIRRPNKTLGLVIISVAAILALATTWKPARILFGFGILHMDDVALTLMVGAAVLIVLEFGKRLTKWRPSFR